MNINLTETRLPIGKSASDLGQSVSAFNDNLILISYQESPIVVDYIQNYVLFVINSDVADSIDNISWSALIVTDTQSVAVDVNAENPTQVTLTANSKGKLTIKVEVSYNNGAKDTLTLNQTVKNRFLQIVPKTNDYLPSYGNPQTTSWVMDSYVKYLLSVKNAEDNYHTELRFLIVSLMYYNLMNYGPTNYLSNPTLYVDDDLDFSNIDLFNGVGVTAIRPFTLFYLYTNIAQPNTTPAPLYNAELNYDPEDFFQDLQKDIYESLYSALDEQLKIDFYNLLRFPKSHIDICKQFLLFLKNKYYPADSFDVIMDDVDKLSALINQFYWGPYDNTINLYSTDIYDNTQFKDVSHDIVNTLSSIDFFKQMLSTEKYGNYDLKIDDSDTTRKYGGTIRALADIEFTINANGHTTQPRFINNLKNDLYSLNFNVFTNNIERDNGVFDLHTEWAVREFQIYASMEIVAVEDPAKSAPVMGDNYISTTNEMLYAGPISGQLNVETKIVLQFWLDKGYKCPVILTAWTMAGANRSAAFMENIWRPEQCTSPAPRMYVRDFSQNYLPDAASLTNYANNNAADWTVLGTYTTSPWGNGPLSNKNSHTWNNLKTTPDRVIGKSYSSLNNNEKSTYKVIAAVAASECGNFFDSINGWDSAIISLGLCHWTLYAGFELGGFLSFYKYYTEKTKGFENDFYNAFEKFGIRIPSNKTWNRTGINLWDSDSKKYACECHITTETGEILLSHTKTGGVVDTNSPSNYFRNWHFFYRFMMTTRTFTSFQRAMYDMIRLRIRDIKNVPFVYSDTGESISIMDTITNQSRIATIGEVFNSEKAFAMLLRIHINSPAIIFSSGQIRRYLYDAAGVRSDSLLRLSLNGIADIYSDAGQLTLVTNLTTNIQNSASNVYTYVKTGVGKGSINMDSIKTSIALASNFLISSIVVVNPALTPVEDALKTQANSFLFQELDNTIYGTP
jgi:hypothetical protein